MLFWRGLRSFFPAITELRRDRHFQVPVEYRYSTDLLAYFTEHAGRAPFCLSPGSKK
ncbi:hypothetical protein AGR6A_Lc160222 [Agrobacterium sp. NCPPB 925]|nr:hypothetical protein AGR6A_Lc160222 [Agrobacterium sp. NCPPB 925]